MKKILLSVSLAFLLGACAQTPHQNASNDVLQGRWIITQIDQQPINGERPAWIEFKQQRFAANAGCNSLMGSYHIEKKTLLFTQVAGTQMYCQETMEQENNFLAALDQELRLSFQGQTLHLSTNKQTILLLEKVEE